MSNISNKKIFYAVEVKYGSGYKVQAFNNFEEANEIAKKEKGELFEYKNKPLKNGENHKTRGRSIKNYSNE